VADDFGVTMLIGLGFCCKKLLKLSASSLNFGAGLVLGDVAKLVAGAPEAGLDLASPGEVVAASEASAFLRFRNSDSAAPW
jgi:hypothetical protein